MTTNIFVLNLLTCLPYFVGFFSYYFPKSLRILRRDTNQFILGLFFCIITIYFTVSNTMMTFFIYFLFITLCYFKEKRLTTAVILSSSIFLLITLAEVVTNDLFSFFQFERLLTPLLLTETSLLILFCIGLKKILPFLLRLPFSELLLLFSTTILFYLDTVQTLIAELTYHHDRFFLTQLITGILFCGFLIFIIVIFLSQQITDKKVKLERERVTFEISQKYMQDLEQQATEIRKFKHDYQNILLTMDSFFNEKAYLELEEYYLAHIRPTSARIENMNLQLSELKKIQNLPLKSLLYTKLSALNDEISLSLEIQEHPSLSEKQLIPFLRTTGILLDNAIEALNELEDGQLTIGLLYQDELMLIIENTCSPDLPAIHQLTTENFSTKGEKRGLGLTNAQQLSSEYGFLLTLTHKDSLFTQILEIGELL